MTKTDQEFLEEAERLDKIRYSPEFEEQYEKWKSKTNPKRCELCKWFIRKETKGSFMDHCGNEQETQDHPWIRDERDTCANLPDSGGFQPKNDKSIAPDNNTDTSS